MSALPAEPAPARISNASLPRAPPHTCAETFGGAPRPQARSGLGVDPSVLLLRQRAVSGDAPRNRRQRRVGVWANRGKADRAFRHDPHAVCLERRRPICSCCVRLVPRWAAE